MLFQYYFPQSLSPARLDRYLAGGWFRSTHLLYRSKLICLEGEIFSPVEIRVKLKDYQWKKRLRRLLRKNNEQFRVTIRKAYVSEEKERLYQQHKPRFKGFIFDSLEQFLYGDMWHSVFDTREVCVYDGDKLIAASFFDAGEESIASILGVYDASYGPSSLGIYTMLLELDHALQTGKKFYYPGYVLDKPSEFDYKLRLGNLQFYTSQSRWKAFENFHEEVTLSQILKTKMAKVAQSMQARKIPFKQWLYPMFSLGYFDLLQESFMRSIAFFACYNLSKSNQYLAVEYVVEDQVYQLSRISICHDYPQINLMDFTEDFRDENVYTLEPLKYDRVILRHADPNVIAERVLSTRFKR